jgi:PST family polysaccharide transporter
MGMGDILVWLAPVGFVTSLTCTTGSVLMARGRTDVLLYLGIVGAVLMVPAFIIGVRWGVTGVAAGYFLVTVATSFLNFYVVFRVLRKGFHRFLKTVFPSMFLACVMAIVVLGFKGFLGSSGLPAVGQLAVLVFVGAATYGVMALLLARQAVKDVYRFFRRR